jgi:hypothetical protein
MRYLQAVLLAVTLCLAGVGSVAAQQQVSFSQWVAPWPTVVSAGRSGATLPDSLRRKVGYQHWKGAAIGAGGGAVLGTLLAFGLGVGCADCTLTTWDRTQAALLVTGAGSVFGFLVGLASPKYVWEAPLEAPSARE